MMITSQKFCFCNWQSFTIRFFLTFSGLLVAQHVLAQVTDSFSDGEFANAPAWSGNHSSFIVEDGRLRLTAEPVAGTAFLSTPSTAIESASWEFTVQMAFNPSSTNNVRIYLVSDSHDLTRALNGYFVMIGDTPDEVSLYRQSGTQKTKIIDGLNGRVNLTSVYIRIRATRDNAGNWELFSDAGNTGTDISEGVTIDNTFTESLWFGFVCTYTATRSDDFFFDDFTVTGSPLADHTPPQIKQLNVVSANAIEMTFSEPLDKSTAEDTANFKLSPGIKYPSSANLDIGGTTITLLFSQAFANAKQNILSITNVEDVSGNVILDSEKSFTFFQPVMAEQDDIIITEIFADPEPTQGLPKAEFIEVFNRSDKVFDLSGWSLSDGTSKAVFSHVYIFPGDYLIVTSSADVNKFLLLERKVGLATFPSLNNSEDVLILRDPSDALIDAVNYSDKWYDDDNKKSGGWSLELIDPQNLCSEEENWIASDAEKGGTPGEQNSVFANKPDLTGPSIVSVIPIGINELVVRFNEKLNDHVPPSEHFIITPLNEVTGVSFKDSLLTTIRIKLAHPLDTGITYSLAIQNIYDCAGNQIQDSFNLISFGVPEQADHMDIVINEILFNPTSTSIDFVELYNQSQKFINLTGLELTNENGNATPVSRVDRLFAPREYLVLSTDRELIIGEYPQSEKSVFIDLAEMPSMNDDDGMVSLTTDTTMIDSFTYSDRMHSPFLKDDEGVSLERISFSEVTNTASNWKSASSSSGFATPGFINSNARAELRLNTEVVIEPEVFSPFESQQGFVLIHYNFDSGGLLANVNILDSYGRTILNVANNELLGASGFFRWDGNASDGRKARIGYYMVSFEVFDATGFVRVFKKRLAIASRF